jgi:hypothetical protein
VSSNNFGHLITKPSTTLQHFATLHHTSPYYTSLHLSTLHFFTFTLHYPLFWLNALTFPTVLFHLTSLSLHSSVLITNLISIILILFTDLKNFNEKRAGICRGLTELWRAECCHMSSVDCTTMAVIAICWLLQDINQHISRTTQYVRHQFQNNIANVALLL